MTISIFMFAISFVATLIWEALFLKELYLKFKSQGFKAVPSAYWFLTALFFCVLGLVFKKESDKLLLNVLITIGGGIFVLISLIFWLLVFRKYGFNPFKSKL
jgi:hypothetical protein